jgi:hypothetical protein
MYEQLKQRLMDFLLNNVQDYYVIYIIYIIYIYIIYYIYIYICSEEVAQSVGSTPNEADVTNSNSPSPSCVDMSIFIYLFIFVVICIITINLTATNLLLLIIFFYNQIYDEMKLTFNCFYF